MAIPKSRLSLARGVWTGRMAWQQLKIAVCNGQLQRVCTGARKRSIEKYVEEVEAGVRQHNQWGDSSGVSNPCGPRTRRRSTCSRCETRIKNYGETRDPEFNCGRYARFFDTSLKAKSDKIEPDIDAGIPRQLYLARSWGRTGGKR